jgi:large repetitive protein
MRLHNLTSFSTTPQQMKNVFLLKGYKTTFLTFLWSVLLSIGVSFQGQAQNTISAPFLASQGFVGIKTGANSASNCLYTGALGFSNVYFFQNSTTNVFEAQGNDIIGVIYITDFNGVQHEIPGFLKWRTPNGSVTTFVYEPGAGASFTLATNGSNGSSNYIIDDTKYVGLTKIGSTLTIPSSGPNAGNISGNAAFTGLLNELNTYLASLPAITITNQTVNENAGTVTLTLNLSTSSTNVISVNYITADSTATNSTDYTTTSGVVTFNPSETIKTITIPIIDDVILESAEKFKVLFSNSTNSYLVNSKVIVTILDNETTNTAPSITTISDQTGCGSFGPLSFTVGDTETAVNDLTVTAVSANPSLFPLSGISFSGSGASRSITIVPASGQVGSGDINVIVEDVDGAQAYISFMVTVDFAIEAGADQSICSGGNANLTATVTDNTTGGSTTTTFDFNSGLQGWTTGDFPQTQIGWPTSPSTFTTQAFGNTANSLGTTSVGNGGAQNAYVLSPALSFGTSVTITFDSYSDNETGIDMEIIEYSVDGGTTWTDITPNTLDQMSPGWSNFVVNFNPISTSTGRIRFRYDTGDDCCGGMGPNTGWYIDNVSVTAVSNPSYAWTPSATLSCDDCLDPTASPLATMTYTLEATSPTGCVVSDSLTIEVLNTPSVTAVNDTTVCAGSSLAYAFTASAGSIAWTNSNTSIGLAGSGSGNIASFATVNAGATAATANISVTATDNGCTSLAENFTITVNPLPTVTNGTTQAVDHGDVVAEVATAGNLGGSATYAWTNSNTTIGLGASGTGNVPQFTAANTTAYVQTGLITVSATANGCNGPAQTYEVSVTPVATVDAVADLTLCAGAAGSVSFTGTPAATFFSWANDNTSVGIAASGTGNISFTGANTTNTAQTANITVTPQIYVTDGYIFGATSEGQTLVLTAPAGKVITSVEFASFGTPTGTAGNYAIGACHASNSSNIISAAALGQNSLTIAATTAVFGNPCVGTSKTLAVKLGVGELLSGNSDVFQVTVNPTPNVADMTIGNCSASTFNATPVNGVDIVPAGTTYTWTVVENPAIVGTSNVSSATPAVSQTLSNLSSQSQSVTYTVTPTAGSCVGGDFDVTVSVAPTMTIADVSTTICTGSAFSITPIDGALNDVVPAGTLYTWDVTLNPNIVGATAQTTPQANISQTLANNAASNQIQIYTVTPQYTVGGTTCYGESFDIAVTVLNGIPSVDVGNNQTICGSGSASFSVNATNAEMGYWQTTGIGVISPNVTNTTVDYLPAQGETGTVDLTYIASNACGVSSDVATITITALPNAGTLAGANAICLGASETLTSSVTGGVWSSSNTAVATIDQNSGVVTTQSVGSTTITYTVTSGSCSSSTTMMLSVNALPTATIATTGATTFCAGGSVALVGPSAPAGMSYTYQWNLNGTAISGATANSYLANASGSYTLTVSNNNGCSATSAATTITVNALPTIAAITGTTTLCVGSGSTLANATAGGTWSTNNAAIATINSSTGAVVAVSAGDATISYTITDANGCTNSVSTIVTVNALPTVAAVTGAAAVCSGATVQFESATAGGSWTSNNTAVATVSATGVVTGVSAGLATITYTITDANGCTNSATADINVNTGATATITAGGATTFCEGSNVVLTANSGSAYMWSTGAQTQSITVSNSGTYSVTVTNASGCSAISAVTTVTVNALPAATILAGSPTNFCQGGSVTLTASPQVAGSTYLWSNGATTASIVANTTSTNTVTITNAAGCATTASALTVTVNPLPTATITASGATTFCQGGSVTLTANGGTGLSYQWSNGSNNQTLAVTTAGSYTVTVTDANGCSSTSAATVVTVNSLPSAPAITGTAAVCVGSTTLLSTTASNPVWSSANAAVATIAANGLVTGVSAGTVAMTYTTTNANGCVNSQSVTVTVNTLPTAAISTMGATTFCQGSSVTLLASSPTAGMTYTYQWRLNGTAITGATASTYVANSSGAYAVTITTNSGCSATSATTTVVVNPLPVLAANAGATSVCEGSTAVITNAQAGGLWSTANNTVATINATTGMVTGVNPGTTSLTYTFTNANGCTNTVSTNFTVNALPSAVITAAGATTFCQGGSVVLTASTGSSYLWSTGATTQSITVSTTQDVSVTVTNANGCAATSAITSVIVNALPLANITSLNGNSFCQGGSVTLVASNGAAYAWSNGAITQSITLSASENVTVTVTNTDGCSATSAPFAVTMNPAPVATITAGGATTFCAGGSVTLTAPVAASYLWSSGETTQSIVASVDGPYSVTITDGNGCAATSANTNITVLSAPVVQAIAGSNSVCEGSTTILTNATIGGTWASSNTAAAAINATGLLTGVSNGASTISYTVTNVNGCTTAVQFNVNVNAIPVLTSITGASAVCVGSTTTLANAQAGGTWSSSDVAIANVAANGVVSGISAGTALISYTYTNAAGCTAQVSASVQINALPVATVTASGVTTFCAGGSVTLSAPAGMTYAWSTGESTQSIVVITSGSYPVTITDANGCSASSAPVVVTVNALPAVSIASVGSTTFCAGGSVTLIAPLNSSYTYAWNNGAGAIAGASNNTYVATTTGSYALTVTDANGCTSPSAAIPVTVNVLPVVTATANGATTFCAGGTVTLTATGATTYVWSNGSTAPSITVGTSGNYDVTGTTLEGCSTTSNSIAVVVNALPTASISTSGSTACLGSSVTLTAAGGATYAWSNNSTNATINVSAANTYTVTVTSAVGCSSTASETVVFNANPAVVISANGPTVFCAGGSLTLTATGGSNYVWSNGDQGASTTVNQSGNYYVIVTNAAGCTTQSSVVSVTVNNNPVVAAITGANAVCEGGTMLLTSATQGGVWSAANNFIANVDAAGHVTGLNAGSTTVTYTVTVNGCTASTSAQVSVLNNPVTPTITASGTTTLCPGGTVVLFASNAANYQWSNGPTTPFIVANQSGSYTVSVTGTNGCSATSLPIEVFIGDNTAPVISAPLNVTTTPNLGCEAIGVSLGTPITSDNCGVASVTNDAPSIFPIGPTVVTWTVTDNSGNSSIATQVVTVIDNSAPTVQAPANVTVASNVYCEAIGVNLGNPIATDNCTENLTITNNAPAVYPLGNTTVTWTIVDGAGNVTTVEQVVTVNDESAPMVLLANTSVILDANGYATIGFEDLDNGSVDNCGIASAVLSQSAFDCANVGENFITVTVTDNSGNQSSASVLVTVIASDACGGDQWAGPSVPDAFTPNGNNYNDTWVIPGLEGYTTKSMEVYSRYGTIVYKADSYANDWDGTLLNTGTPVPDGTYYYILTLNGGKQLNGYVYVNRVQK